MKVIYCILVLVLGTFISLAEPAHWQDADEIESWIRSKEKLEIAEYDRVLKSLGELHREGRLDSEKGDVIWKTAGNLAVKKFVTLIDARDYVGTCEFFEGVGGSNSFKITMMDSLTDCKDVEFSARVVHHALGGINWDSYRAFSLPHITSRRNLFDKVMGESETYGKILSEYGKEDFHAQKAMKQALEKKWPVLLEENTRESKRKPPTRMATQDTTDSVDSSDGNPTDSPALHPTTSRWLLFAGLALSAAALLVVLLRKLFRRP